MAIKRKKERKKERKKKREKARKNLKKERKKKKPKEKRKEKGNFSENSLTYFPRCNRLGAEGDWGEWGWRGGGGGGEGGGVVEGMGEVLYNDETRACKLEMLSSFRFLLLRLLF